MLSKKTQDVINTIKNIYVIVQETMGQGYSGSMKELIRDAIRKTAEEDHKEFSTVADSLSRRLGITGKGSWENIYDMLEAACTGKEPSHSTDDLLIYIIESMNSNDDSEEEIRRAYLNIWP